MIRHIIKYIWGSLLYLISVFIPRSKKIWIFGAWAGRSYADNPKYLFEYVCENHPNISAIWLTHDKKIIEKLAKKNLKGLLINSPIGIWYAMRAKVGVTSHGMVDINRFACAKLKLVETWHAIPIKPILLSDPKGSTKRKRKMMWRLSFLFPFLRKELDYNNRLAICGSSDFTNQVLKKVFGANAPIINTGFPRLDGIFNPEDSFPLSQRIAQQKKENKTIGIYMPTYRRKNEFDIINYFINNMQFIDKELERRKHSLYLRIHPFDLHNFPSDFSAKNIEFISNSEIEGDIYKILGLFDYLITDYSSVIFDFLIQPKPVFLFIPDIQSYIESNGALLFDYDELGIPASNSWSDLFDTIDSTFRNSQAVKLFERIGNKIHYFMDEENSKRLYYFIKSKL